MGNKARGEVTVKVDGQDCVLRFGVNEICQLEDELDKGINEIISSMDPEHTRIGTLRTIFRCGLSGSMDLDDQTAGKIMEEIGIETAGKKIGEAFKLAFGDQEKSKNPKKGLATK